MSIHIGAKKGDIAEVVLLPGDPYRAKWVAETFLEDAQLYNDVRGMLGYTGTYRGKRVSVQGSGMGMPSLSIYVRELLHDYDVRSIIRIGSCGGLRKEVKVGDLVIAMSASTDSSMNRLTFDNFDYAPTADWQLLRTAVSKAEEAGVAPHVGQIFSGDRFYPDREHYLDKVAAHGALAVEMEASALYTLAARYERRALAICTVSDSLVTGEELTSLQRQTGFKEMATIALETALSDL